jgi:hypothetical protein
MNFMNKNKEVREMYLTVDLETNTILLKHWRRIGGETVRVSCEVKAYNENGRAADVLLQEQMHPNSPFGSRAFPRGESGFFGVSLV